MEKRRRLQDEYRFPGFRPRAGIKGVFGDSKARVIRLERTQKKLFADVARQCIGVITTRRCGGYGICHAGMHGFTWKWKFGESNARGVGR
jgi:hypothetical protein